MKVCPLNDFAETFSSVQFSSALMHPVMMIVGEPFQDEQEVVPDLLLSGGRDEMGTRGLTKAEHLVGSGREHVSLGGQMSTE